MGISTNSRVGNETSFNSNGSNVNVTKTKSDENTRDTFQSIMGLVSVSRDQTSNYTGSSATDKSRTASKDSLSSKSKTLSNSTSTYKKDSQQYKSDDTVKSVNTDSTAKKTDSTVRDEGTDGSAAKSELKDSQKSQTDNSVKNIDTSTKNRTKKTDSVRNESSMDDFSSAETEDFELQNGDRFNQIGNIEALLADMGSTFSFNNGVETVVQDMDMTVAVTDFTELAAPIIENIAEILGATTEEVVQSMQELGIDAGNLLDGENVKKLVLDIENADNIDMLVDESLGQHMSEISQSVADIIQGYQSSQSAWSGQESLNVQNGRYLQTGVNVQDNQNVQNMQNVQDNQNVQNMQNVQDNQNVQNMQNVQGESDAQNLETHEDSQLVSDTAEGAGTEGMHALTTDRSKQFNVRLSKEETAGDFGEKTANDTEISENVADRIVDEYTDDKSVGDEASKIRMLTQDGQTVTEKTDSSTANTAVTDKAVKDTDAEGTAKNYTETENYTGTAETVETTELNQGGGGASDFQNQQGNDSLDSSLIGNLAQALTEAVSQNGEVSDFDGDVQAADIVRQVVDEIKANVNNRVRSLEIKLNPENLGRVQISVTTKNGVMQARIIAESEAAKNAIEGSLNLLKEAFNEQNLKVEAVEVTIANYDFFKEGNEAENNENNQKNTSSGGNKDTGNDDIVMEELSDAEQLEQDMMQQSGNSVSYAI